AGRAQRVAHLRGGGGLGERTLRQPDANGRHADPPAVERLEELAEAVPAPAEQIRLGNACAVEGERPRVGRVPAHLAVRLADLVAGRALRADAVRDLAVPAAAR